MTDRKRLGLIVPSSNTVAEVDFLRGMPPQVTVHTARVHLVHTTAAAERAMLEEYLPQAARDLGSIALDATVFSCTSAAALLGAVGEDALMVELEQVTGAPVISTAASVATVLARFPGARVAVVTGYIDELNRAIAASLRDRGVDVTRISGLGLEDNYAIGLVEPADIAAFAEDQLGASDADVLFVSCTNLRAVETIAVLERRLGIPVVTSNAAAITVASERLGVGAGVAEALP